MTSLESGYPFEEEPANYHQTNRVLSPGIHDDPRFNLFVEGLREKSNFSLSLAFLNCWQVCSSSTRAKNF